MRTELRIPIVLDYIENNERKVLEYLYKEIFPNVNEIYYKDLLEEFLGRWLNIKKVFEDYYKRNPDYRLTQILVNLGIINNYMGFWYYLEDEEIMIFCGLCGERDIYFWANYFDSEGKSLDKINYILIKDLETSYIRNILNLKHLSNKYINILSKELNLRLNNNENSI